MGRGAIFMVMGFNLLLGSMGFNLSKVAINAYQNYTVFYDQTVARQVANSAANMASSEITFTPNWRTGYSNMSFQGGTFNVTFTTLDSNRVRMEVSASYNGITYPDTIVLGLTKFSKFAYFSNVEGSIQWITGDTVYGPFHTEDKLNTTGNPVFMGRATAKKGLNAASGSHPVFNGDFQSGLTISLPTNFTGLSTLAQSGGKYFNNQDIYLEFKGNGNVVYRVGSWTAAATTTTVSAISGNGLLIVNNGNLHLKGIIAGQMTVGALGSSGKGTVYIDSSIAYNTNPQTNPNSTDMLGICVDNNVVVSDNVNNDNPSKGVTLQASILARTGGLGAENYDTRPVSGTLRLYGGVQQYQRGAVGTFSGTTIVSGFGKSYMYDPRLMITSPPLYPSTGTYEVLSWYE